MNARRHDRGIRFNPEPETMATSLLPALVPLIAPLLMLAAALAARWRGFHLLAAAAWLGTLASLVQHIAGAAPGADGVLGAIGLKVTAVGAVVAALVQLLGTVLGHFSARYLQGEPRQERYVASLGAVLACVHLLVLADHWVVLIAAWAGVGLALQRLLCFYPERPFALLAARKKRLFDRAADVLLCVAAALAWRAVGSGSFTQLFEHVQAHGVPPQLQGSALLLAAAVILRTALLPVHGWLIQVMEAPTPVSALLHAGVVNLGGYVLVRMAPLLEQATAARWLLVVMGACTAVAAGLVMLTRVSIKVRLAWSTAAQMGFMVLECGLGLPTLALLHLVGHSLYKFHAFLLSSDAVRQARLQEMAAQPAPSTASVLLAPVAGIAVVGAVASTGPLAAAWPAWWSVVLGLAWAPLLWQAPQAGTSRMALLARGLGAVMLLAGFTLLARFAHALPLQLADAPQLAMGLAAVVALSLLYGLQATLRVRPALLPALRRWSYAGFYLDEYVTRLALRWSPRPWLDRAAPGRRAFGPVATPSHS